MIYVTKGIPLLKESRLETFADGGGEGVLGRIVDVTSIFCLYSFFKIIKYKFKYQKLIKHNRISLKMLIIKIIMNHYLMHLRLGVQLIFNLIKDILFVKIKIMMNYIYHFLYLKKYKKKTLYNLKNNKTIEKK